MNAEGIKEKRFNEAVDKRMKDKDSISLSSIMAAVKSGKAATFSCSALGYEKISTAINAFNDRVAVSSANGKYVIEVKEVVNAKPEEEDNQKDKKDKDEQESKEKKKKEKEKKRKKEEKKKESEKTNSATEKHAKRTKDPLYVKELVDTDIRQLAVIRNMQREDYVKGSPNLSKLFEALETGNSATVKCNLFEYNRVSEHLGIFGSKLQISETTGGVTITVLEDLRRKNKYDKSQTREGQIEENKEQARQRKKEQKIKKKAEKRRKKEERKRKKKLEKEARKKEKKFNKAVDKKAGKSGSWFSKLFSKKAEEKVTTKATEKVATKTATKTGVKVAGKAGIKCLVKKIPVVSAVAGCAFAAERAIKGDWAGAGGELASGVCGCFPGVGTAASLAIDGGLAYRDIKQATVAETTQKKESVTLVPQSVRKQVSDREFKPSLVSVTTKSSEQQLTAAMRAKQNQRS